MRAAATKSGANAVIEGCRRATRACWASGSRRASSFRAASGRRSRWPAPSCATRSLLILDEPTSSLDPQAEYEVFAHFRELTPGKSAIFISHRFSTVRLANRILVLEDGAVLERAPTPSYWRSGGRYAELFALQAEAYR